MEAWLVWGQIWILASIRLTVGLGMTPLFSAFNIPALARLVVILSLASVAATHAQAPPQTHALDAMKWLHSAGQELAIGLLLAVGVHVAFAALTTAGRLIDVQMGFNLGAVLDPVSKSHSAIMASGLSHLGVVIFFVSDAHHVLMDGAYKTFEVFPPGADLSVNGWAPVAQGAGAMFSMGLAIASPVVVALLLTDVFVSVLSRNLPQMNVLFLSIPLKVILGLIVMMTTIRFMSPYMRDVLHLPVQLLERPL